MRFLISVDWGGAPDPAVRGAVDDVLAQLPATRCGPSLYLYDAGESEEEFSSFVRARFENAVDEDSGLRLIVAPLPWPPATSGLPPELETLFEFGE